MMNLSLKFEVPTIVTVSFGIIGTLGHEIWYIDTSASEKTAAPFSM
jgi:hypothetical protein